ncbi:2'-5' RNA ligase family protein [Marinimicrobium agarilyticum]|uniref:2'-5' RNA ligase family protein n=1 Tax=Marinimicrobium agarilyticum TaxID=306546 RepID=UPI00040DAE4B|nr:hypothetical protein [Marinimicrobium agarilyticum]
MPNELLSRYDLMWRDAVRRLQDGQYELDPLINSRNDTRRGVTALAYLKSNPYLTKEIGDFLTELKRSEPRQYFYPESDLHLTVLSIISCEPGLRLGELDREAYSKTFRRAVQNAGSIKIHFRGVTASPSCILIQGFPEGEGLGRIRDRLREAFGASGLKTSIDARYKVSTAHATVLRFRSPIRDAELLLKTLSPYRAHHFGTLEVDEVGLVFNNWYQNQWATTPLSCAGLGNTKEHTSF